MTWRQLSGTRTTIHRSQIGTFLAGITSAVIYVESCAQEPKCYENRKGFGNTRLLEACKLNMKLWNNCVLFIYSMEMISGIQLAGYWPISISEAIKRKFSSYEPHGVESGVEKKKKKDLGIILNSWKQKYIKSRCQETKQSLWVGLPCRLFQSFQRDLVTPEIINCCRWCPSLCHLGPRTGIYHTTFVLTSELLIPGSSFSQQAARGTLSPAADVYVLHHQS